MIKRIFTFVLALALLFSVCNFYSFRSSAASAPTLGVGSYSPGILQMGSSYVLKGTISASSTISDVWIKIIDSNQATVIQVGGSLTTKAKTYNINNLDSEVRFGSLLPGSYYLKITCTLSGSSTEYELANNLFQVKYDKYNDAVMSKVQDALYNWMAPVRYEYLSPTGGSRYFGAIREKGTRSHAGIDYIPPTKENNKYMVYAMDDGIVLNSYLFYEQTYALEIQHSNGLIARYCEIGKPLVKPGDSVRKGDHLAYLMISKPEDGSKGTIMLHLELYNGDSYGQGNPVLTDRKNNKYKYTDVSTNFQRRSDLLNPTFIINLLKTTTIASTIPPKPPVVTPEPAPPSGYTSIYRFYNPNTGEHFLTGSGDEKSQLLAAGWKYEGIAFFAPINSGLPVYRMCNPNNGDHHFTMSSKEKYDLEVAGWNYEGIAFNSDSSKNSVPQYRMYNPNATVGAHHFAGSVEERDNLIAAGWKYEGIGFYGVLS